MRKNFVKNILEFFFLKCSFQMLNKKHKRKNKNNTNNNLGLIFIL